MSPEKLKTIDDVIIASKHLDYNLFFAEYVEGADKKAHREVLMECGLSEFAEMIGKEI